MKATINWNMFTVDYMLTHGALGCSSPIPNNDWNPYAGMLGLQATCQHSKPKALKDIPIDNFLDWNGDWFKIATDHALTLPILYRLWKKDDDYSSVGFIDEPLYMHTFYGNPTKPRSWDDQRLIIRAQDWLSNVQHILNKGGILDGRKDA